MKTYFIGWTIGVMLVTIAVITNATDYNESPNTSRVSIEVFKAFDYKAEVYRNTTVEVQVVINKINGTKRKQVYATSFLPSSLSSFATADVPFSETVVVSGKKTGEYYEVEYFLTYRTLDQHLQLSKTQIITQKSAIVDIIV